MRFDKMTVLVTGAASGIGLATARLFAREGANLILSDIASCADVAGEIEQAGGTALRVEGDVSNSATVEDLIESALSRFTKLDVVIHNAGIGVGGTVDTVSEEDIDRVWAVNFKAAFLLAKHAVPIMRRQKRGTILFTGAVNRKRGAANSLAYGVSKAALMNMAQTLAIDHGRDGIRVNVVSPGPVQTPMLFAATEVYGIPASAFAEMAPTGRIATPENIAESFSFLSSSSAHSITGQTLVVDNGISAGMFAPQPVC